MKQSFILALLVLMLMNRASSQTAATSAVSKVLTNQVCPDFVLDTLLNYKKNKVSISEWKGKCVIVDFWGTFCGPCIEDFPIMEKAQQQFGDRLQVMLIAVDGYERVKRFYETRKKGRHPMILPCAVNRAFKQYIDVKTVSTYVWIDDQGVIKAITDYSQLNEKNISDFVNKKEVHLREREPQGISLPVRNLVVSVANERDSSNVLYSSSFTRYLKGIRGGYYYFPKNQDHSKVIAWNMPIELFYRMAYGDSSGLLPIGRVIMETAHPEKFRPNGADFQTWRVDNTFCYELRVPAQRIPDIRKIMQQDVNRFFNMEAVWENRKVSCLVLKKVSDYNFTVNKALPAKISYTTGGVDIVNKPFQKLVDAIFHYRQTKLFFDETGITGNIDISFDAEMNNEASINVALKKYGLRLQYEDRVLPMLVIKDPRP